jgi:predicted MFS family arabinose efflux permease
MHTPHATEMNGQTPVPRAIWYLLAAYFFGATPSWLVPTAVTLNLAQRGVSPLLIGTFATVQFSAILLAAPLLPRLSRHLDARQALLGGSLLTALIAIGYTLTTNIAAWLIFGALWGFISGVRWIMGESLVAELAPPARRGAFIGAFETMIGGAAFVGPSLLLLTGTATALPFALAVGLLLLESSLLALMCLPKGSHEAHGAGEAHAPGALPVLRSIPAVLLAALIGGIFESGTFALLPVYGLMVGLGALLATSLVTAIGVGSFLLQYPLGFLADRVDIHRIFLGSVALMLLGALALPLSSGDGPLLWALAFLWGGVGGGLYTLAMVHIGRSFRGATLVRATSLLVVIYTVGSAVGPLLGGLALDLSPRYGLPLLFATIGAAGLLALVRTRRLEVVS